MQPLIYTAALALSGLTAFLYLGGEWPWPAATMLRVLTFAAAAGIVQWLAARPRPTRAIVPYVVYAAALVTLWLAAPTPDATRELWRQVAFLTVLAAAAAPLPAGRGALVGLHVACLLLVFVQLAGPRSAFDGLGRAATYHALEQWSGYPELGLLMAVGAGGTIGLAVAARSLPVRLAATVLAVAFGLATVYLQSRASTLTIPIVAVWLLGVAVVKWRSKMAVVGLAAAIALSVTVVVRGGGVPAIASRGAETLAREMGIREQGWNAARTMAGEHPVTGVGLGGYQREYEQRHLGRDSAHPYNIVLHVLAEGGVIGLLGWLALWTRALWVGVRAADRSRRGAAIFALHGMLVAFLLRSQSEHFLANLATSDRLLLLVALWIGLSEGLALDAARLPLEGRAAPAREGAPVPP
jgi:O-antigen ligase